MKRAQLRLALRKDQITVEEFWEKCLEGKSQRDSLQWIVEELASLVDTNTYFGESDKNGMLTVAWVKLTTKWVGAQLLAEINSAHNYTEHEGLCFRYGHTENVLWHE